MTYAFPPAPIPAISIANSSERFPVHRIYCVGKNYAAHVVEMGSDPGREPPCFFSKPADAIVTGREVAYPLHTDNFHYEGELVIAIGRDGINIPVNNALEHVFGYAIGLDLTRRDLQYEAVERGQPWDTGKGFDHSAPLSPVHRIAEVGHFESGRIRVSVNGDLKQNADFSELIWTNQEIIARLSSYYELKKGDLIFTGTPAGVGPLLAGDEVVVEIDRLGVLAIRIV